MAPRFGSACRDHRQQRGVRAAGVAERPWGILSLPFGRVLRRTHPSATRRHMPEILTESFCERCGTRYTFEATAPRIGRLTKFKIFSKGQRNYVLSDETTLDEALADARSDEDRQASTEQLDAFHKTFNFCMSCRQYTCGNCWNEVEGRCLTCAPNLGHDLLDAPFPMLDAMTGLVQAMPEPAGNGHGVDTVSIAPLEW